MIDKCPKHLGSIVAGMDWLVLAQHVADNFTAFCWMIGLGGSDERAAEDCDPDRPGWGAISGRPANGSSGQNAMANVRTMKTRRGAGLRNCCGN